jgi:FlaA1/EpsC-like NDP-sugar epimerase
VPKAAAALVETLADVLIDGRPIEKLFTGIRPGEKIHEIMVSEEECYRTVSRGDYYAIRPMLPELHAADDAAEPALQGEYSSSQITADAATLRKILATYLQPRVGQPA